MVTLTNSQGNAAEHGISSGFNFLLSSKHSLGPEIYHNLELRPVTLKV